jgi:hypothetical protein
MVIKHSKELLSKYDQTTKIKWWKKKYSWWTLSRQLSCIRRWKKNKGENVSYKMGAKMCEFDKSN